MTRIALLGLLTLVGLAVTPPRGDAAEPKRRPNIVFLLADDLGFGDLACYGCKDIKTPHLDRLARDGVRFNTFYSNGPECSPTRAALLSGRYQQRVGGLECAIGLGNVGRYDDAIRLQKTDDLGLPVAQSHLARLLKNAGYRTSLIGKWHLGYPEKFAPSLHGFDHTFYSLGGGMDYFHHVEDPPSNLPVLRQNGKAIERKGYFTDLIADEATRFIADNKSRPFFLYVPFTAPHAPYQGPGDQHPTALPADSPLWKQGKAPPEVYAAMVERMDEAIGRILAELTKHNLAGDTLVVFTSDNGGTASARPTPFRGFKGTTFEGGVRVPCIVRWPGKLAPGTTTDQVGITMDWTRSFVRVAGAAPPAAAPFDGIDLLERLEQRLPPTPRTLYWRARRGANTRWAVREGDWKYVAEQDKGRKQEFLFDLVRDPSEKSNLLEAQAEVGARLRRLLTAWEAEVRPER